MTASEIEHGFRATIDQFYKYSSKRYVEQAQLHFVGGVLQSALHILPNDKYFALKEYIYIRYGYDPGGCKDGQISLKEIYYERI